LQGTSHANTTEPFHVHVTDETVSVRAQDIALIDVLRRLAHDCQLRLVIHGDLDDQTSVRIIDRPLHAALRKLLRGYSFALRYARPGSGIPQTGRPNTLWIFSTDPGDGQVTVITADKRHSAIDELSIDILTARLQTADTAGREAAVDLLGDIGTARAVQLLELALADPEVDVREAAIDVLGELGGDAAAQALAITLQDEDASLREETVDALGEIGGETATRLLRQALHDEQPFIREAAAEHLARLMDPGKTVSGGAAFGRGAAR
jgi:hypothetical protein